MFLVLNQLYIILKEPNTDIAVQHLERSLSDVLGAYNQLYIILKEPNTDIAIQHLERSLSDVLGA